MRAHLKVNRVSAPEASRALTYAVLTVLLTLTVLIYQSSRLEAGLIRDAQGSVRGAADEVLFVTDSSTIQLMSLGYRQAAADLVWLRSVQYFATHMLTDRRYPWLEHFVHQVIKLDPRFRQVYMWAGSCVLYGGEITPERVHASNKIYEAALKMFPNDYEPAYRLGMNYYSELRVDDPAERERYKRLGLAYFERAARMPNAPPSVLQLIRGIAKDMSRDDILLYALNDELARAEDETIKARITERIERVSARIRERGGSAGASSALAESLASPRAREIQALLYQTQRAQSREYLNALDYEVIFGAPKLTTESTSRAHTPPLDWRSLLEPQSP